MNGNVTPSRSGSRDFPIPGNWPKVAWVDQGIGTPETALRTLLWALRENCGQRADQVMLANPPCPAVSWDDIVCESGAIARCDGLFILARLDESTDRAIIMGHFGNRLQDKMPILAFDMVRVADAWRLQGVRVF